MTQKIVVPALVLSVCARVRAIRHDHTRDSSVHNNVPLSYQMVVLQFVGRPNMVISMIWPSRIIHALSLTLVAHESALRQITLAETGFPSASDTVGWNGVDTRE